MSNDLTIRGNLGDNPSLKYVQVGNEERVVCELRVYADNPVPDGAGGFKDNGGFWMNASLWGRRAEHAARTLRKGMRVEMKGYMVQQGWTDKDTGVERSAFQLNADEIYLDISRVESITMRARQTSDDASES